MIETGIIYCDDNLERLRMLSADSVDLIYLDPPFFSNRNYEVIWGDEAEVRSFSDRWAGGIEHYIAWMRERCVELRRVLKATGSLYLHCDPTASHYLKVMLDETFTRGNFRNEIIWSYRRWPSKGAKFQTMHDVILFYTAGKHNTFNVFYEPPSESYMKRFKGKTQVLDPDRKTRKLVVDEPTKGMPQRDVWDISIVAGSSKERLGYPTQKPETLLERILQTSSNKG